MSKNSTRKYELARSIEEKSSKRPSIIIIANLSLPFCIHVVTTPLTLVYSRLQMCVDSQFSRKNKFSSDPLFSASKMIQQMKHQIL